MPTPAACFALVTYAPSTVWGVGADATAALADGARSNEDGAPADAVVIPATLELVQAVRSGVTDFAVNADGLADLR